LIIFFTFLGCAKDESSIAEQIHIKSSNKTSTCELSISYEVETTILQRPVEEADTSNLSIFERIGNQPDVSRKSFSLCVYEDESLELEVNILTPTNPYTIPHQTLPNPSPSMKRMQVIDDTAYFYDENGNLLFQKPSDISDLGEIANFINQYGATSYTMEEFVDSLTSHNISYNQLDSNFISVSENAPNNNTIVTIYSITLNRIVAISVYDINNELNQRIMYTYDDTDTTQIKPEILWQANYSYAPNSGVKLITESISKFNNFSTNIAATN